MMLATKLRMSERFRGRNFLVFVQRVFICVRTLRAFKQLGKGKCDKFILTGHPDYEKNFIKLNLNRYLNCDIFSAESTFT